MNTALAIVVLGGITLLAHLFTESFSRTRIPDVLWLILIGLGIGPLGHIIAPDDFGVVGPIFITITLVIILFQSGIGLSLNTLLKSYPRLITIRWRVRRWPKKEFCLP
jgi:potassium/hydrogen antiporter